MNLINLLEKHLWNLCYSFDVRISFTGGVSVMSLQILKVMFRLRKECHNHDTQENFLQIYEEQIMNWNMTLI